MNNRTWRSIPIDPDNDIWNQQAGPSVPPSIPEGNSNPPSFTTLSIPIPPPSYTSMNFFKQQSGRSLPPRIPQGNSNPLSFRTLTQTSFPGMLLNSQPGPSVPPSIPQDINCSYGNSSQLLGLITDMQMPSIPVDISSDGSSSNGDVKPALNQLKDELLKELMEPLNQLMDKPPPELSEEGWLLRMAKSYQDIMKLIPIPTDRNNVIPYMTWEGLACSMKVIYKQPLHYLTNRQLKMWDKVRREAEDEGIELNILIPSAQAETTIWLTEEIHRRLPSPKVLMECWKNDPAYLEHIDGILPST